MPNRPQSPTVARPTSPGPDLEIDLRAHAHIEIDLTDGVLPLLKPEAGLLGAKAWQRLLKRLIDMVVGTAALVVLFPVFVLAAVSIKLTSPGPVFYSQTRVGQHGRKFAFLKLRTMYVDAEVRRDDLAHANESDGPVFKIRQDPRVTPVGRVLRRLSIDELPQLIHVIEGDMSLVGPRPPLPSEVEEYSWAELQRLLVKPGVTCIWQVSGRADLTFSTWVRMDLEYIEGWSTKADLELLAMTVPAVLSGKGAY